MKRISAILAAVSAVALSPCLTSAAGPTPEWTIAETARIMKLLREKQSEYCTSPRSKTSAECNSDFESIYPVWAEAGAWQVLLLRYPEKAKQYKSERDRHHKNAISLIKEVERLYLPRP